LIAVPAQAGIQLMRCHLPVYILASQCNGTLHAGITSNLITRIWQQARFLRRIHEDMSRAYAGLVRTTRPHGGSHRQGKTDQEMELCRKIRYIEESDPE
jgi:hypothetical protein